LERGRSDHRFNYREDREGSEARSKIYREGREGREEGAKNIQEILHWIRTGF